MMRVSMCAPVSVRLHNAAVYPNTNLGRYVASTGGRPESLPLGEVAMLFQTEVNHLIELNEMANGYMIASSGECYCCLFQFTLHASLAPLCAGQLDIADLKFLTVKRALNASNSGAKLLINYGRWIEGRMLLGVTSNIAGLNHKQALPSNRLSLKRITRQLKEVVFNLVRVYSR